MLWVQVDKLDVVWEYLPVHLHYCWFRFCSPTSELLVVVLIIIHGMLRESLKESSSKILFYACSNSILCFSFFFITSFRMRYSLLTHVSLWFYCINNAFVLWYSVESYNILFLGGIISSKLLVSFGSFLCVSFLLGGFFNILTFISNRVSPLLSVVLADWAWYVSYKCL